MMPAVCDRCDRRLEYYPANNGCIFIGQILHVPFCEEYYLCRKCSEELACMLEDDRYKRNCVFILQIKDNLTQRKSRELD